MKHAHKNTNNSKGLLAKPTSPQEVIDFILAHFEGVEPKSSWGETSLFYNPGKRLPNGVYFSTIKEKNGENDQSSDLDREGVFRLSIGIGKKAYEKYFGARPTRPAKGGIVDTGHDFSQLHTLMPHPIYAWMSWVQILNPQQETQDALLPLLSQAYDQAVKKFEQKIQTQSK